MKLLNILFLFVLMSCGGNTEVPVAGPQGPIGNPGVQGTQGEPGIQSPSPIVTLTPIQQIVAYENDYRLSVGQQPYVPGLACTLYTVPNTTTQIVSATLTTVGSFGYYGVFNQPNSNTSTGLNILPAVLQSVYQNWIIVKCSGSLIVSDNNWHSFSLASDDGSNLYIDGLLINNDGLHGVQTVSGVRYLKRGFHSFQLDFLQGAGQQALILKEDGDIMTNTGFYH